MVLPSPFKILERVAVRYRKGQIKESVRIKIPAFSFPKRRRPASCQEKKKKAPAEKIPEDQAVLYRVFHSEDDHFLIAFGLFFCDSGKQHEGDCVGDRTGERRIRGRDIPVRTP